MSRYILDKCGWSWTNCWCYAEDEALNGLHLNPIDADQGIYTILLSVVNN